jgi:GH15 family glucan-1,4-alpha-glucosidase
MYGIGGERRLHEHELDWLPGYEDSAPVRVGNGAWDQLQLDAAGMVFDALHLARVNGVGTPTTRSGW